MNLTGIRKVWFAWFFLSFFYMEGCQIEKDVKSKPNIIYILADDLGYADVGCYGQSKIQTPNIDKLASSGIHFKQHYAGSTVCAPSRCALLTGLHTGHSRIRGNLSVDDGGDQPLIENDLTIADLLKAEGYKTAVIGKWGLGGPESKGHPGKHGFDYFFGILSQKKAHRQYPEFVWRNDAKVELKDNTLYEGKYFANDLFIKEAVQYLQNNSANSQPFYLYLAFSIPHIDLAVPSKNLNGYLGKFEETPYISKYWRSTKYPRANYAAMVAQLDLYIGEIIQSLNSTGLKNKTVVMLSSDNGPEIIGGSDPDFFDSNGIYRGYKRDLYEGGLRIPMIVSWPGVVKPGTTSDHISAFWDVMPTLCEIAGAPKPVHTDGISFLPTLKGEEQPKHDYLYWEFNESIQLGKKEYKQAVRMGNWKGVYYIDEDRLELFDLSRDISEKNNLAEIQPDVVKKIRQIMIDAHQPNERFPLLKEERTGNMNEAK